MKPFSTKVSLILFVLTVGEVGGFIICLLGVSIGVAQLIWPIHPLYVFIVTLALTIIGLGFPIRTRINWESRLKKLISVLDNLINNKQI